VTLRDVGKRGEGILQSWASEEDASLTKTDDDRWGWDFLLEFPIQRTSVGAEPDKEEEVYRCLIQVKSTSSSDRSCQVKMSNWRRLVETPLPAFFLVLRFDSVRACREAFLVHVGEDEISKVLRKARELGVAGEGDRLHKHTLVLQWCDEQRLPGTTGQALLDGIRRLIGPSPADYSKRKLGLRERVGYDAANAQVTTLNRPGFSGGWIT